MSQPRVLVIDDEQSVRDAFTDALAEVPYTVETACDGKEALAKAQSNPTDLIFLDLKMPGMDGVEVLHHIRELDEAVPIYIVTAFHAEFLDRLRVAEEEGLSFQLLHKPIGQAAIRKVATAVLASGEDRARTAGDEQREAA